MTLASNPATWAQHHRLVLPRYFHPHFLSQWQSCCFRPFQSCRGLIFLFLLLISGRTILLFQGYSWPRLFHLCAPNYPQSMLPPAEYRPRIWLKCPFLCTTSTLIVSLEDQSRNLRVRSSFLATLGVLSANRLQLQPSLVIGKGVVKLNIQRKVQISLTSGSLCKFSYFHPSAPLPISTEDKPPKAKSKFFFFLCVKNSLWKWVPTCLLFA